jgi:hypothetical protein
MTSPQPATPELLTLAAKMRPDWDRTDLSGALAAAASNGWDWPKTFLAVCRLLADSEAAPRDLIKAVQNPVAPPKGRPGDYASGAAKAWASLGRDRTSPGDAA